MVNKKQPAAEKASKTSKPVSSVKKEKKSDLKDQLHAAVSPKVAELFKDYYQKDGRIFLTEPRTYGELPDLLDLQKK